MKKSYRTLLVIFLLAMIALGTASLFETEAPAAGESLAARPVFTVPGLLDGSWIREFEDYYSDHFPLRHAMLDANRGMNQFYYFSGIGGSEEENVLILGGDTGAEFGGESLHNVEQALTGKTPEEPVPVGPELPAEPVTQEPEQTEPEPEQGEEAEQPQEQTPPEAEPEPEKPAHETPELANPAESEAQYAGSVVIVGNRAMEIPTRLDDIITTYAEAINALDDSMGDGVRTISLLTPNGAAFYAPESMHTGAHDQQAMIDFCYSMMDEDIVTVDAYSSLREYVDEYIYFRTDHHWTQLGAYHAYEAFCEAAGFDAVPLDSFETGRYDRFVGSMYTFTKEYPQSAVLVNDPDYLDYYLPVVETHAQYYGNQSLENGVPVSVVYTSLDSAVSNKYLCFIGGDTPICVIETAVEDGPVCMVLKESYGNAFVPFLTSHYSRIIVIDPREFNVDGRADLVLAPFAQEQGVDDLIVINYPYMMNRKDFVKRLRSLAGE